MTEKEMIQFLESYQKNKAIENILVLHIAELQKNAMTAKGINYESNGSSINSGAISKSTLPEYIYSKIMDMKEDLLRSIYSNSIRLKYIEEYIYNIGVKDTRAGTILCYKYVIGLKTIDIEKKLGYCHSRISSLLRESLDMIYKIIFSNITLEDIEGKIYRESSITRKELDDFYENFLKNT